MEEIVLGISNWLSAFDDDVVGSKVISGEGAFLEAVTLLLRDRGDSFTGIGTIEIPPDYYHLVRSGVACLEGMTKKDYHLKDYRGQTEKFARPSAAAPVDSLSVVVYSVATYFNDPDVLASERVEEERQAFSEGEVTHVLVAIHAGDNALSERSFVNNVAGGNLEFIPQTAVIDNMLVEKRTGSTTISTGVLAGDCLLLDKMVNEAKKTKISNKKWVHVADVDKD